MESTTLASSGDAELILKLYDLRREATMRTAREWVVNEFWPISAQEVLSLYRDFGSQHNQYLRQVTTYWEMAASFVLRGAVDADLFVECTGENIYILAKFHPFLAEIRAGKPDFLIRTEQLAQKHSATKATLERLLKEIESRRLIPAH